MKNKLFKIYAFVAITLLYVTTGQSQENATDCEKNNVLAEALLTGNSTIAKDTQKAIELFTICANKGDSHAQYTLGMLYKKGKETTLNEKQAFNYIQRAALQGNAEAVCELGVFYKDGFGCKLDFDQALEWFEKATDLGNAKGAYSIGYIYFKGLGSIEQDYAQAIKWFQKSDYPMAKHWLAVCYYMGYGTKMDKEKSLEFFLNNPTKNSKNLLEHFENNKNLLSLGNEVENTTKATEFSAQKINETIATETENTIIEISNETLKGDWEGKLIELDWSGEKIQRSFPVSLSFKEKGGKLNSTFKIQELSITTGCNLLDTQLQLENNSIQVPRLLQTDKLKFQSKYRLLSLNEIEIKEFNNIKYFIADVEAKEIDFREPATPMMLVLGNTKTLTENGKEINEALIAELAKLQNESFITLYPNPFKNDLLIQYDLEKSSITTVGIYSLDGHFSKTIISGQTQNKGNHIYHFDGTNLVNGLYVVKVTADNIENTKLIVKE